MTILKVGIVGLGEVTQIIHLPALAHLAGQFEVTALCDVSEPVLNRVAMPFPSAAKYVDYRALVIDPNVDVVLVANPHAFHTPVTLAALAAGKHVFIEKPMAMNLAEADEMAQAAAVSGKAVQVGYVRRYSGAFLEAVQLVNAQRGDIRFARVHDFIGFNELIIDDTSVVMRDKNLPAAAVAELRTLNDGGIFDAIGTRDPEMMRAYSLLLGLSSHDISAMRELLGVPKRVLHASQRHGGLYINATFDYGDFVCEFATGVDSLPRFDAYLEVYLSDRFIRVDYDTPYIRNLAPKLTVVEPHGTAGISESVSFPSRLDLFVTEWQAFHDHVTKGTPLKTNIADARPDLEIFAEIMEHLKRAPAQGAHNVAS